MKPLRKDLRALADDAAKLAQSQVVDPAVQAYRQTREAMRSRATQAEHYAAQQCDRIAHQISARPFTAVAIAFVTGWMISSLFSLGSDREA